MEMKIARTEKKGFMGRQRYVSEITITFTDKEREFIKKKGLKNYSMYDYKRDGGPQGTTGYYDEMPLFMFLDRPVPVETSDPQLSELIESAIAHHLKSLKERFNLEGSFGGSETTVNLDD